MVSTEVVIAGKQARDFANAKGKMNRRRKPCAAFANFGAEKQGAFWQPFGVNAPDPIALFQQWYADARVRETDDVTAMALATVDAAGHPAVRMVLMKHFDARGFVFYTNLESPKADQLRVNPRAELCFHWAVSERQVRIAGKAEAVSATEADAYFASRPRLSQLGAWASRQSQPMAGRFELEQAVAKVGLRFAAGPVPRPPHWSGYRVVPEQIEFWHQRPFRHHDRRRFTRQGEGWQHEWLFP